MTLVVVALWGLGLVCPVAPLGVLVAHMSHRRNTKRPWAMGRGSFCLPTLHIPGKSSGPSPEKVEAAHLEVLVIGGARNSQPVSLLVALSHKQRRTTHPKDDQHQRLVLHQ